MQTLEIMSIGENIRRLREQRGTKNPSLQVGRELARLLGYEMADLFRNESPNGATCG